MSRLRFALDMDGVIYDWHSAVRFLISYYRGRKLPPVEELFKSWNGYEDYVTKDDIKWLWSVGVEKGLFRHGHVRKGAIEFCNQLSKIAQIVIITHRPEQARQDTLDWISFHRIPTSEIHMMHKHGNKALVPVSFALDDKPENVVDFLEAGVNAKLWDRPWNKHVSEWPVPPSVSHSWEEVLSWVREKSESLTK